MKKSIVYKQRGGCLRFKLCFLLYDGKHFLQYKDKVGELGSQLRVLVPALLDQLFKRWVQLGRHLWSQSLSVDQT